MKQILLVFAFGVTLLALSLPAEGKRITLVPLSASEVYRILREAGKEDAVPEGRVVSQGIAAVSGFAVGLAKGVGGSILFDIAANLLRVQNQTVQTQEICFNSRSLNEIDDDEEAGDDDYVAEGRQAVTTGTGSTVGAVSPTTTGSNTVTGSGTNTASGTTTQTGTGGAINCVVIQQQPSVPAAGGVVPVVPGVVG